MSHKVAVILSGCGYLDGAEIRESVLSLLSLDRLGAEVSIFAPDEDQYHTVNHLDTTEVEGRRNILEESARIARGQIRALTKLDPNEFSALVLPGGFGVAKNLSSLAFDGPQGKINPDLAKVLRSFYEAKKPIGAICIAPAVICLELGREAIEVTIGNDAGTAEVITSLGAKHVNHNVDEIHVDEKHRIVSTPAYMYGDANISAVATGIEKCIAKVFEMLG